MLGQVFTLKKDVTITPKAQFDEKDVRVLDQESALVLKGALTNKINVSISEQEGGENKEISNAPSRIFSGKRRWNIYTNKRRC